MKFSKTTDKSVYSKGYLCYYRKKLTDSIRRKINEI